MFVNNDKFENFVTYIVVIFSTIAILSFIAIIFKPISINNKQNVLTLIDKKECIESGKAFINDKELTIYTCNNGKEYIL